jgi:bifunctional oligoribonuclease and PAP phosphatase NrnA
MNSRDRALIDSAARALKPLLESARKAVLCTHVNPDGDGIGAEICLYHHLRSLGIATRILNTEPLPLRYRFLDPGGTVEVFDPGRDGAFVRGADLIVMLDNSAVARLGPLEDSVRGSRATTVCIDHHDVVEPFWKLNIVDEQACATGELVFQIVKALGGTIGLAAAEAAYVSLVTDTGSFRFSKTSPRCHEAAAEMLALGVAPPRVYQEVYERNSLALVRLGAVALAGLRLLEDGRLACITLTRAQVMDCDADTEDTSDIVNGLLAIEGVRVAVMLKEIAGGRIKLSLRSKKDLDVNRLAARFGGGGHRNAAGAVLDGPLQEALETVLASCRELLRQPA